MIHVYDLANGPNSWIKLFVQSTTRTLCYLSICIVLLFRYWEQDFGYGCTSTWSLLYLSLKILYFINISQTYINSHIHFYWGWDGSCELIKSSPQTYEGSYNSNNAKKLCLVDKKFEKQSKQCTYIYIFDTFFGLLLLGCLICLAQEDIRVTKSLVENN